MKVLIFYASYGGGHLNAAKSIENCIKNNYKNIDVEMIDCMKYVNKTIEKIGDYKVLTFKDVERDYVKDMVTGKESKTGLPKSNVLYYALENDSWCCVRPSGTEPKIKLYMGIKGTSDEDANKKLKDLKEAMVALVKSKD